MARNKHPEETVAKILDVSMRLFTEQGYEHTTIQDIGSPTPPSFPAGTAWKNCATPSATFSPTRPSGR